MWLQWTEDEASLLTEGDDRESIYQLFKRALADYQSRFHTPFCYTVSP